MKLELGFERTHMPYLANINGKEIFVFCAGDLTNSTTPTSGRPYTYMRWIPYYSIDGGQPVQLEHPEGATICSPIVQPYEEGVVLVYSSLKPFTRFHLYRAMGLSIDALGTAIPVDFANGGFFHDGDFTMLDGEDIRRATSGFKLSGFKPNRIAPWGDKLLITGSFEGVWRTLCKSGETLTEIRVKGDPVYKCCIYNDRCYYAKRIHGFEDREIHVDDFEEKTLNDPRITLSFF